jgi:hypothetical protein
MNCEEQTIPLFALPPGAGRPPGVPLPQVRRRRPRAAPTGRADRNHPPTDPRGRPGRGAHSDGGRGDRGPEGRDGPLPVPGRSGLHPSPQGGMTGGSSGSSFPWGFSLLHQAPWVIMPGCRVFGQVAHMVPLRLLCGRIWRCPAWPSTLRSSKHTVHSRVPSYLASCCSSKRSADFTVRKNPKPEFAPDFGGFFDRNSSWTRG